MSKYFRLGLIAVIGVSCVLLFLLVLASQNSTFFEKYYTLLLWLNTIIALVFLGLVCVLLYRLYRRAQKKKYGVKILSKFALALGLTGVVPWNFDFCALPCSFFILPSSPGSTSESNAHWTPA